MRYARRAHSRTPTSPNRTTKETEKKRRGTGTPWPEKRGRATRKNQAIITTPPPRSTRTRSPRCAPRRPARRTPSPAATRRTRRAAPRGGGRGGATRPSPARGPRGGARARSPRPGPRGGATSAATAASFGRTRTGATAPTPIGVKAKLKLLVEAYKICITSTTRYHCRNAFLHQRCSYLLRNRDSYP